MVVECKLTLGHICFICWITFHFEEFQSVAIRKKIKIKFEVCLRLFIRIQQNCNSTFKFVVNLLYIYIFLNLFIVTDTAGVIYWDAFFTTAVQLTSVNSTSFNSTLSLSSSLSLVIPMSDVCLCHPDPINRKNYVYFGLNYTELTGQNAWSHFNSSSNSQRIVCDTVHGRLVNSLK